MGERKERRERRKGSEGREGKAEHPKKFSKVGTYR